LVFCGSDSEANGCRELAFYFDTRTGLMEGEHPILRFDYTDGSCAHFADSFALFLENLVRRT